MLGTPFKTAECSQPCELRRLQHSAARHPLFSVLLRSVLRSSTDVSVSGWGLMFYSLFLQVLCKYLLQGWRGDARGETGPITPKQVGRLD